MSQQKRTCCNQGNWDRRPWQEVLTFRNKELPLKSSWQIMQVKPLPPKINNKFGEQNNMLKPGSQQNNKRSKTRHCTNLIPRQSSQKTYLAKTLVNAKGGDTIQGTKLTKTTLNNFTIQEPKGKGCANTIQADFPPLCRVRGSMTVE